MVRARVALTSSTQPPSSNNTARIQQYSTDKMSTQATPSILFTHSTPQQGFRLLELPPELVDLVSSDDAPTYVLPPLSYQTSQSDKQLTKKTQPGAKIPPEHIEHKRERIPRLRQPLHTHPNVSDPTSPVLEFPTCAPSKQRRERGPGGLQ